MIRLIGGFLEELRSEGLAIAPDEAADAARALEAVGIEERDEFRFALRCVLARDREDARAFDAAFDRYFRSRALPGKKKGKGESPGGMGEGKGGGRAEGSGASPPRRQDAKERPGRRPPARSVETPERRRRQAATEPARHRPRARDRVERLIQDAREEARREGRRPPRVVLEHEQRRRGRTDPLLRVPVKATRLRPVTLEEERALSEELPGLLSRFHLRPGRRSERSERGRVWISRVFRESAATMGVPFTLPRRRPRRQTASPVLLVDVSWSVRRAAGLFLLAAAEVALRLPRARVLLFVDRPVEATREVRAWARSRLDLPPGPPGARPGPGEGIAPRGGPGFATLLRSVPGLSLDAASDYGTLLYRVLDEPSLLGRGTVLAVLGDARTNVYDPLPWALEEIASRVGRVLWIVPEPAAEWGTGDSALPAYLPHVDLAVEARDTAGLLAGIRELARGV